MPIRGRLLKILKKKKKKRHWTCQNNFILDVFWLSPSIVAMSKSFNFKYFFRWKWLELLLVRIQFNNKPESILKSAKYQNIKGDKHTKYKLWSKLWIHLLDRKPMCNLWGQTIGTYKGSLHYRSQGRKLPSQSQVRHSQCTAVSEGTCSQGRKAPWQPRSCHICFPLSLTQASPIGGFLLEWGWEERLKGTVTQYSVFSTPVLLCLPFPGPG